MKKITLLTAFALSTILASAQSGFPTKAQAEKYIQSNAELRKEVEAQMGVSWNKLTVTSDGWKGYRGSVFSLTTTNCGRNIRNRGGSWPDDAAYAKWIVTGPKNAKGIYKIMGIYMDYDRTSYDGEYCTLGNWKFEGYRLESAMEYGHKEFTQEEMKKLFFDQAEAGKIEALNYFIEINPLKEDAFTQNVPQPGQRYIWVYFNGTLAKYAPDHSILHCEDQRAFKLQMSVSQTAEGWVVDKSVLQHGVSYNVELNSYQDEIDQYCKFPETPINYESYESAGWDAVYGKRTPRPTDQGKYGQLQKRIDALYQLLNEKGTSLTEEDLNSFVLPSNKANVGKNKVKVYSRYYMPFQTEPKQTSMHYQSHSFSGAFIISKEYDGKMMDIAFPGVETVFHKSFRKGKNKWEVSSTNPMRPESPIKVFDRHQQPWFFENGEWYVYDYASVFFSSEAASAFLKKLMSEESSSGGMF